MFFIKDDIEIDPSIITQHRRMHPIALDHERRPNKNERAKAYENRTKSIHIQEYINEGEEFNAATALARTAKTQAVSLLQTVRSSSESIRSQVTDAVGSQLETWRQSLTHAMSRDDENDGDDDSGDEAALVTMGGDHCIEEDTYHSCPEDDTWDDRCYGAADINSQSIVAEATVPLAERLDLQCDDDGEEELPPSYDDVMREEARQSTVMSHEL